MRRLLGPGLSVSWIPASKLPKRNVEGCRGDHFCTGETHLPLLDAQSKLLKGPVVVLRIGGLEVIILKCQGSGHEVVKHFVVLLQVGLRCGWGDCLQEVRYARVATLYGQLDALVEMWEVNQHVQVSLDPGDGFL